MARTQSADYEQRREAMLDQAAALFARTGFQGTSMADLAVTCKVSKSLLYHYFPSKEDLLYEVMTSHLDQLVEDVRQAIRSGGSGDEALSDLVHALMRHYVGAADRHKVLLNELANLPEQRRSMIVDKQRSIIDATQDIIRQLPEAPAAPATLRAFTMLMFGMINWTHTWYDPDGPISPDALAEMVTRMVVSYRGD